MNAQRFLLLKSDIDRELRQLDSLAGECREALAGIETSPPALELRGIGSILHDFYCGVERVFERVAVEMDGELPHGRNWHIQLLERVAAPVETVRPAVVRSELSERLREYLRFRHLFRNVYGFELRWELCRELAEGVEGVLERFKGDMESFKEVLTALYRECG